MAVVWSSGTLLLGLVLFATAQTRVCPGNNAFEYEAYESLRTTFENCTYVIGNIAIEGEVSNPSTTIRDYSFLESIEVIRGYLFVSLVPNMAVLPLKNLQIVHGRERVPGQDSSFVIQDNVNLEYLHLQNLYEVSRNNIVIKSNTKLCGMNGPSRINWQDLVGSPQEQDWQQGIRGNNGNCPVCANECMGAGCWNPKDSATPLCQILRRIGCDESCGDRRCRGSGPDDCCDYECVGGCTGPSDYDCIACKTLELEVGDQDRCVSSCPGSTVYDPNTGGRIPNEDRTYHLFELCLEECPANFYQHEEECRQYCPDGYEAERVGTGPGTCRRCEDGLCRKSCSGFSYSTGTYSAALRPEYENCTVVLGDLLILDNSFTILTAEDLEVFQHVRTITGKLVVQLQLATSLTSLDFLRNLETVQGQEASRSDSVVELSVTRAARGITSIGWTKFNSVGMGGVYVLMIDLCYQQNPFVTLMLDGDVQLFNGSHGTNACNKTCHTECAEAAGCWAGGSSQCVRCVTMMQDGACVSECSSDYFLATGVDAEGRAPGGVCLPCHEQCHSGCTGPSAMECTACVAYKDVNTCKEVCPNIKYGSENSTCEPCSDLCDTRDQPCTGPSVVYGRGGCSVCLRYLADAKNEIAERCIDPMMDCPDGYFLTSNSVLYNETLQGEVCEKCAQQCGTCSRAEANCRTCTHMEYEDIFGSTACTLLAECPPDTYHDSLRRRCPPCHTSCETGCTGPGEDDCIVVNNAGLIGGVVGAVIIILLIGAAAGYYCMRQRNAALRKTRELELEQALAGPTEEPLCITEAAPDRSTLRVIEQTDLRVGVELGSGAFGTVYGGAWYPADRGGIKIAVAIKVLKEDTPDQNEELLAEARVMASINHEHCVKLLSICMARQLMLVTPLMRCGGILDYMKKNRKDIGSRTLLNWCLQIAKGMKYLEDRKLVHRDLAARNVLLKSPNFVKIADFGLSKLLEHNATQYEAVSGKMPIKWMALESIEYRIFTSKTDVWSYGVTIWELFTFGARPYEMVHAREMLRVLSRGQRLNQPNICTLDVYMVMVKCWVLNADSRPTFGALVSEFSRMAQDPGRYLVIEGDNFQRMDSVTGDADDMLKGLEISDDSDKILMDADEYLKPESVRGFSMSSISNDEYTNSFQKPLGSPNGDVLLQRNQLRSDGSVRYCATPSKSASGARTPSSAVSNGDASSSKFDNFPASPAGKFVDIDGFDACAAAGADGYLTPQSVASDSEYLQPVDRNRAGVPPSLQALPETEAVSFSNFQYTDFARSAPSREGSVEALQGVCVPRLEPPPAPGPAKRTSANNNNAQGGLTGVSYANVFDDTEFEQRGAESSPPVVTGVANPEYMDSRLTSV